MKTFLPLLFALVLVNSSPIQNDGETPQAVNLGIYDSAVDLYFLNRNSTNSTGVLVEGLSTVNTTGFNPKLSQTIFLIHGWQDEHISTFNEEITAALLNAGDFNIFLVDWKRIANQSYVQAQSEAVTVGNIVGTFITGLISGTELSGRQVGLIGHSLGAHIAGIAGARGSELQWIVGLDPSGPLYSLNDTSNRLDAADAVFVQVIHTCAGLLGIDAEIGTADYWPNNGRDQPGCESDPVGTCSHGRAYEYYIESLASGNFISTRCNNYTEFAEGICEDGAQSWMGQSVLDIEASGNYYLATNDKSPFAKG